MQLHAAGEHTIAELAELFAVSRPTVYRVLERHRDSTTSAEQPRHPNVAAGDSPLTDTPTPPRSPTPAGPTVRCSCGSTGTGASPHPSRQRGRLVGDPTGRMTPTAAGQVVARLADAADLEGAWSGHSLRRGFATAARLAGHDMLRIGRTGGWADGSRALAGYIEDVDRVTGSPLVGIGI